MLTKKHFFDLAGMIGGLADENGKIDQEELTKEMIRFCNKHNELFDECRFKNEIYRVWKKQNS